MLFIETTTQVVTVTALGSTSLASLASSPAAMQETQLTTILIGNGISASIHISVGPGDSDYNLITFDRPTAPSITPYMQIPPLPTQTYGYLTPTPLSPRNGSSKSSTVSVINTSLSSQTTIDTRVSSPSATASPPLHTGGGDNTTPSSVPNVWILVWVMVGVFSVIIILGILALYLRRARAKSSREEGDFVRGPGWTELDAVSGERRRGKWFVGKRWRAEMGVSSKPAEMPVIRSPVELQALERYGGSGWI